MRFQGKPGIKKVLKKEYVLQNRATGKDVNAKQKWETVFRPGLWFDMDMIFQKSDGGDSEGSLGTKCIRCHAQSEQPRGLGSTWYVVAMLLLVFAHRKCKTNLPRSL